ncbi:MAG: thiamine pyrophosphate-dependent enzyme [Desulfobacterales bacterium]
MGEIIHAANRGEKFTTIFVNNAVYGMTGGQMAPTTMPGQRTTTSPFGRDVDQVGMPVKVAELLAALPTPAYVTRQSVIKPKHINRAKKAIRKAFQLQRMFLKLFWGEFELLYIINWLSKFRCFWLLSTFLEMENFVLTSSERRTMLDVKVCNISDR